MHQISVVHLVWKPLGPGVFEKFIAAYCRHPAGVPHQLVILYNGFEDGADRAPYERILAGVEHVPLVLPAPVQDLPAYLTAARALASEYVCFLNSYSEPLAPGWLGKLYAHAARAEVGLVGASGSWESHNTLTTQALAQLHRDGPAAAGRRALKAIRRGRHLAGLMASYVKMLRNQRLYERMYDPFPNHHVRTNGFMLRRELMLALRWPTIRTKMDALAFESGRDGLTRQIEARGLGVLVVGRDGVGYAPADWWRSGTYRGGDQHNLLVDDNRTRQFGQFDALDEATKARIFSDTWGPDPGTSGHAITAPAVLADP